MNSFCAMYSLRMSVWIVPRSSVARHALLLADADVEREQHRRRRVDRHRRRDFAERNAGEQRLHVLERVDRDALAADLAERARRVGVVAHQRRHVERGREPGLPVLEQVAEALVRLRRGAEAGELAHRPEPAAVHRRVDAARERIRRRGSRGRARSRRRRCRRVRAARSRSRRSSRRARPAARATPRTAPCATRRCRRASADPRSSPSGCIVGSASLRPPGRHRISSPRVRGAREDEEQVGEPVQVDRRRAGSPRSAASARRSARRQIARARKSRAADSLPPGRTKLFSGSSRAFASSHSRLEPVDRLLRDAQPAVALGERHREVGADVEELVLDALERRVRLRRRAPSRARSSARRRRRSPRRADRVFEMRDPSPRLVSPASPPRV